MAVPAAPWSVSVTPVWLSTPRGSGAVPVPRRAARSTSTAICPAKLRAMTSSDDGSASSNSSTLRSTRRTRRAGGGRDPVEGQVGGGDVGVLGLPGGGALAGQAGQGQGLTGHRDRGRHQL